MSTLAAQVRLDRGPFRLDVAVEIPLEGVAGVFGASGAGKTTLLRCLAGLEPDARGDVRLGDTIWQADAPRRSLPPHRRGVGYVSQEADLFSHLTVRDNLAFGFRRTQPEKRRLTLDEVTEWLSLEQLLDRAPGELSGGERQRVAIGRALAASPKLLLMDEPVASLDQPARGEIVRYLQTLPQRIATPIVYVSHSLAEITRLADWVVWMADGSVRASDRAAAVLAQVDWAGLPTEELAVTVNARIRAHDERYGLTELEGPWGLMWVHRQDGAVGSRVRVQVRAADVSLGLGPQEGSSILNEFALVILDLRPLGDADAVIRLTGGPDGTILLARVTRKSADRLGLKPGRRVYTRVKAVAVVS
jgi:molybdate transport system ATP-binding protein